MSSRKQQHDYARRRYEKWLAHQEAIRAKQRRRRLVIGWILGVLALAAAVWLVVQLVKGDDSPAAQPTAPATAQPTVDPSAPPTTEPTTEPSASATPDPDVPDPALAEDRTWTATVHTSVGDIVVELDGRVAPQGVAAFISLAQDGFYDATTCDRLTTTGVFLLECGDPTGTGQGGPDWRFGPIENAPATGVYKAGTVALDRDPGDAASMGSRFFIVYEDSTIEPDSAGGYTVLGRITEGMDALRLVAAAGIADGTADTPATDVTIEGVDIE